MARKKSVLIPNNIVCTPQAMTVWKGGMSCGEVYEIEGQFVFSPDGSDYFTAAELQEISAQIEKMSAVSEQR